MIPVFKATQIKEIDAYTIKNSAISSIELMDRAVLQFCLSVPFYQYKKFVVFAGPGNNGGDALGVALRIHELGFPVSVFLYVCGHKLSPDCETKKQCLLDSCPDVLKIVDENFFFPDIQEDITIIDGLFGNGLNRPLQGIYAEVVKRINLLPNKVIAIDMPSGLMAEDNGPNIRDHIVKADYTYTFQYPKLSFFFAENEQFVGQWRVLDIDLKTIKDISTDMFYVEMGDVAFSLKCKSRFAHKGSEGHALLVAGQPGMAGAALLAAKACMKAGAGKVTVATQEQNRIILQLGIPEAILLLDDADGCLDNLMRYQAIGIGPGIGTEAHTADMLGQILNACHMPMVIDADAINILAVKRNLMTFVPPMSILTPHKLEFKRLVGESNNDYDEFLKAKTFAREHQVIIVLKGAFTKVVLPDGNVYVNPTGNPGMATAGAGDVLTGGITALLAQGYKPEKAAVSGVFLHGLAGDLAAEALGQNSLIASDIIDFLPKAFTSLEKLKSEHFLYQ